VSSRSREVGCATYLWRDRGGDDAEDQTKVTRSSGNVFRDLGFPSDKAQHLLVRADLMIRLETEFRSRGLSQAQAAALLGITQPRISDMLRGRVDLFSADALIDMLARLGIKVRIVTTTRKRVALGLRPSAPGDRQARSLSLRFSGSHAATGEERDSVGTD
jgi:predicted XRE-type DNA-binding protein